MLFNSLHFFLFFPLVTLLYFTSSHKYRWFVLLAASCYFYMSFVPIYILVLATTIIIDYFAGRAIESSKDNKKKIFLVISILSNIGILFIFKYFNFFNQNVNLLAEYLGFQYYIKNLSILLPIGLSFHTFQSLSYIIEVYRGKQSAEKRFGIFALYVMFYPQLVAGPIERPQNLLHQFYEKHSFELKRVADGLKLMLWGFFKKIFIADRLANFVDQVYNNVPGYDGLAMVIATVFFAFQIYCDFSGYSDIAIGAAQVMGFKLMNNFRQPYFSVSISEFWKRWHISLSSWFRDYLYIPLGGNRVNLLRIFFNIFIVFLVSGLWHGANWMFLIWGGLNGVYLIAGRIKDITKNKLPDIFLALFKVIPSALVKAWQILITFSLVCFAWIFFRAKNLEEARYVIKHIFLGWQDIFSNIQVYAFNVRNVFLGQGETEFKLAIAGIIILIIVDWVKSNETMLRRYESLPSIFKYVLYFMAVLSLIVLCDWQGRQFIYFQF